MRRRGLRLAKLQITNYKSQIRQRGYMLITLMLALALITIGLLTVLPEIGQQIRRDREEEMRHRGTAYMRAIQHFYKKFGRYPMRIEELEKPTIFVSFANATRIQSTGTRPRARRRTSNSFIRPTSP